MVSRGRLKLAIELLVLSAAAFVTLAGGARRASATAGCSRGRSLYTVAHEDDSILFQLPDLEDDLAAGRCVETVFFTAGDAGRGFSYWSNRELGIEASYAELTGTADTWTKTDAGIPGHPITVETLAADPQVTLVFMHLPDGGTNGNGFAADGSQSLQKLWIGTIDRMTAVDGSSTYTRSGLVQTVAALATAFQPDQIGTQDFAGTYSDGDHSDHHTAAYLTRAAGQEYTTPHTLEGFGGYPISFRPVNLTADQEAEKQAAFFAYAPFDPGVCQTVAACDTSGYSAWWSRRYITATQQQPDAGAPSAPDDFYVSSTTEGAGSIPYAGLGDVLGASGTWAGSPVLAYQWQRCDSGPGWTSCVPIAAAHASTYTVSAADLGHRLALVIEATNPQGVVFATEHAEIAGAPLALTSDGAVLGTATVGSTLTLQSPSSWAGDSPITFSYQWRLCDWQETGCSPIDGATAPTYTPAPGDAGFIVSCVVSGSNTWGIGVGAASSGGVVASAPVVVPPPSDDGGGGTGSGSGGGSSGSGQLTVPAPAAESPPLPAEDSGPPAPAPAPATPAPAPAAPGPAPVALVPPASPVSTTQAPAGIRGTAGNDHLVGTNGPDSIYGGRGADWIDGRGGSDVLWGGAGDDTIVGGAGADRIYGGSGNDVIRARDGQRDFIDCGPGRDVVFADVIDSVGRSCEVISRR